ncbi:hypothetical protein ND16A_1410 [Thalassotalea sp. ND16A]|nr:hypothetical protein ND16A_1410 [Thalassotalea sp. ND16A]
MCLLQIFATAFSHALEPETFKLSGINVTPQISISQGYSDNLLHGEDRKEHTVYNVLAPKVTISQVKNLNFYQLDYGFSYKNNAASGSDNYTNHQLTTKAFFDLATRHRILFSADYLKDHEERGQGYSIGFAEVLQQPTANETLNLESLYTFGAKTAQANIDVVASYQQVRWQGLHLDDLNLPDDSDDIDYSANREYDQSSVGARLHYKTGAFTKVTFRANVTKVTYNQPREGEYPLDSKTIDGFVGFEWQGSALTTGYVRLGYENRNFDQQALSDESGLRWQVGVLWRPLTYSNFDFSSSKNVSESKGQGTYIKNTNYTATWHHQWLDRIATNLAYSLNQDEYGGSLREDDNYVFNAGIEYQMRRNLECVISLTSIDRSSNFEQLEYNENQLTFTLNASF